MIRTSRHLLTACLLLVSSPAWADWYIGQIFFTAGPYCPEGTLKANGSLVSVRSYTALFALLGTRYGGDAKTSFALPNITPPATVTINGDKQDVLACIVENGFWPQQP